MFRSLLPRAASATLFGFATASPLLAVGPVVTATQDDGVAATSRVTPGTSLTYSAALQNTGGGDATGVTLTNPAPANTSDVAGSLTATPVAVDDVYPQPVIANLGVNTATSGFSVVSNDFKGFAAGSAVPVSALTVAVATGPAHGSVTLTASGADIGRFSYTPTAGYTGADSFTYTLNNGVAGGNAVSTTGTVSLTVAGPVTWFVNAATGNDSTGDGTLAKPFQSLTKAATVDAASQVIFLYSGNYSAGLTMAAGELLLGQGASGSFDALLGIAPGSDSPARPALAGANPAISGGITLATNNTLNGFSCGSTGSATIPSIAGNTFGTLTVTGVAINNPSGPALNLNGGTTSGTGFTAVNSGAGANNVLLASILGTLNLGSGALSGASSHALVVTTGSGTVNYSGTITNTTAKAVQVAGKTGGTVALSGAITISGAGTGTSSGIDLTTNTGATINLTGPIAAVTGANTAFNATGGGTLAVTNVNNTLTTTTATALNVVNTTIAAGGLKFTTITAGAGNNNGIVLDTTGTSGGLSVTGTGTAGSGGSLSNKTGGDGSATAGSGIYLKNCSNVALAWMSIQGNQNYGIRGHNVTGFTLDHSSVGTVAANGSSITADVDASLFQGEGGVRFYNLLGTATLSNCTLDNGFSRSLAVSNDTGTLTNLTITNSAIRNSLTAVTASDALYLQSQGASTSVNLTVTGGSQFTAARQCAIQTNAKTGSTMNIAIDGSTFQNSNPAAVTASNLLVFNGTGTNTWVTFSLNSNTLTQGTGAAPAPATSGRILTAGMVNGAGTFYGKITNNTFGVSGLANSAGGSGADAIGLFAGGDNGSHGGSRFLLQNNTIQNYGQSGIQIAAVEGNATIDATLLSNTIRQPGSIALGAFAGIWAYAGSNPTDTNILNIAIGGTSAKNTLVDSDPNNLTDVFLGNAGVATAPINLFRNGSGGGTLLNATEAQVDAVLVAANFATLDLTGNTIAPLNLKDGLPTAPPLLAATGGIARAAGPASAPDQTDATPGATALTITPGATALAPAPTAPPELSQSALDAAVAAALARWEASGLTAGQVAALRQLRFETAELSHFRLGEAAGNRIRLSRNAGGNGWYVDASAASDNQFGQVESPTLRYTEPAGRPAGRMDLLTAVLHEMGHALGLDDSYAMGDRASLMYGQLTMGERRLPTSGQAAGAQPFAGEPAHFLTAALSIGTLPAGKSVILTYQVKVNDPIAAGTTQISSQGSVSGSNFATVLTDDPEAGGTADPTLTLIQGPPSVTPNTAAVPITATSLVISGTNFDPTPANNQVTFSGAITGAATVTAATTTQLTVTLSGLETGPLAAIVTSGAQTSGSAVQVATLTPVVTSSTATLAANATTVTLNGFGFSATAGNNSVAFSNGATGTLTAATATTLTVTGVADLVAGPLTAVVTTHAISSGAAVQIATVTPVVTPSTDNLSTAATSITIHGFGFASSPASNSVTFSGSATGTVTTATPTALTVTGLAGLTTGNLTAVVTSNAQNSGPAVQVATVIPPVDYTVTTTGNAIVVTDVTGNGDTLVVSETGVGTIQFAAAGRAFSIDGAATTTGDSGALALTNVTAVTLNAAAGNDLINVGAFTSALPNLTLNGGSGNDTVNLNGSITFAANANLDLDLQNDDATPGIDIVNIAANAHLLTSGTGTIVARASQIIHLLAGASLETENGGITVEGNLQTPPVAVVGAGLNLTGATLKTSGSGAIIANGRAEANPAGLTYGTILQSSALIVSTSPLPGAGSIDVTGTVPAGFTFGAGGIIMANSQIRSAAGPIHLTAATGAGSGPTAEAIQGVALQLVTASKILATGNATITIDATSGTLAQGGGHALRAADSGTQISSVDGNIQITALAGNTPNAGAVGLTNTGCNLGTGFAITASGLGSVTVTSTAGDTSGASQGLRLDAPALITTASGDIHLTGTAGNGVAGANHGNSIRGNVTATGAGNILITGTAGPANAINASQGVQVRGGAVVSSASGNLTVDGSSSNTIAGNEAVAIAPAGTGTLSSADGSHSITVVGDSLAIDPTNGTLSAGAGSVTLRQKTNARPIDLGAADSSTVLGLTDAELNRITAGTLTIGDANSGAIAVSAAISPLSYKTLALGNPAGFGSAGGFVTDIGSTAAVFEKIALTGTLTLDPAATLSTAASGGFVPQISDAFILINNDGTDAVSGTFAGLPEGATIPSFLGSTMAAHISYVGGDGNDVVLTIGGTVSIATLNDGSESATQSNGAFRVTQSGVSATDTVVSYTVGGSATGGSDFTALSGSVIIPAGQTAADLSVAVLSDTIVEATETVVVTLTGFTAGDPNITLAASPGNSASLNITDDDTATLTVAKITDGVEASTPTNGLFRITQPAASSSDTVVSYSLSGNATSGSDFTVLSGTATIAAGSTTADISVAVLNDPIVEPTETVSITLTAITASRPGVTLGATLDASLNIADNDSATVTLAKITDGAESNSPTSALFRVTQSAVSSSDSVLTYSTGGSATSGSDFTAPSGSVTIAAGQSTADISIPVLNDAIVEATETVSLTLSGFTARDADVTLGSTVAATADITDNDTTTVTIAKLTDGAETNTPSNGAFRVTQTGISSTDTVVNLTVSGSATAGSDFTALPATATIVAGQTTADLVIAVLNDNLIEPTETVIVTLGSLGTHNAGVAIGSSAIASLIITDNDLAASIESNSGAGQSAAVNTAFANPLVAIVKDSGGVALSGASVTFTANGVTANGSFSASATVTTNGSGLATAPAFTANTTAGSYTVTATTPGVVTAASFALTNTPAAASKLLVSAPPTAVAGTAVNVTVTAADPFNNTSTAYAGTVHLSATDAAATLPANATLIAGVRTFSVTFATGGNQTVTATDTVSAPITGTSPTIVVSPRADLAVTLSATPNPVNAAGDLTFTVNLTNNGPSTAVAPAVILPLPASTTFVSAAAPESWSATTPAAGTPGTVAFGAASLAAGGTAAFTVVARVDLTVVNDSTLSAAATASSATTDPDPANNIATSNTTAKSGADLQLTLAAAAPSVIAGTNLTYTMQLQNHGPLDAENVTLIDTLPSGTTFVSLTGPAAWTAVTPAAGATGAVNLTNPLFANGATATFTLVVKVAASEADGTLLSNAAAVGSSTIDIVPGNNSASANSPVTTHAVLAIQLTGTPASAPKGSDVSFGITVTNNGPSDASAPAVSFPIPAQMTFVSATTPGGWSATTPAAGGVGTVAWSAASLATGATVTFTVVANVNPTAPTGTILTAAATASAADSDPVTANLSNSTAVAVGTVDPTGLQLSTTGVLNHQNGLFELIVNVSNATPRPVNGFRLHVDYSAYLAAYPSLRLYNATSPAGSADAYIDYPYPLALDAVAAVKLSFYTSSRTFPSPFTPVLTVDTLAASQVAATNGNGVQASLVKQPDQTVLLEFPAVSGRWYRVRYSSDLSHWSDCPVPVQAATTRLQWIDSGPPFTTASPATTPSRFYIVNEILAP